MIELILLFFYQFSFILYLIRSIELYNSKYFSIYYSNLLYKNSILIFTW